MAGFTFWQYASLLPFGLITLILIAEMSLHTVGLEQANAPISGWYFLLVVPLKFLKTTLVMVRDDGNSLHRVMLFCP
jgi:hypothetical protein